MSEGKNSLKTSNKIPDSNNLAEEGERVSLWEVLKAYQIVSLPGMYELITKSLLWLIQSIEALVTARGSASPIDEDFRKDTKAIANRWLLGATDLGLPVTAHQAGRIAETLSERDCTYQKFNAMVLELRSRLDAELASVQFLYIPIQEIPYYRDEPQFGKRVARKFPKTVTDIQESGKCLALGRTTATVFHLMRVMETAVQYLGTRLGIALASEKHWHNILDEVDKAIKHLPISNSREKAIRNRFAEASAHLRMVKDAWRNDVMHPKETYTEEEAARIFRNVKDFMVHLAAKI